MPYVGYEGVDLVRPHYRLLRSSRLRLSAVRCLLRFGRRCRNSPQLLLASMRRDIEGGNGSVLTTVLAELTDLAHDEAENRPGEEYMAEVGNFLELAHDQWCEGSFEVSEAEADAIEQALDSPSGRGLPRKARREAEATVKKLRLVSA